MQQMTTMTSSTPTPAIGTMEHFRQRYHCSYVEAVGLAGAHERGLAARARLDAGLPHPRLAELLRERAGEANETQTGNEKEGGR